MKHRKKQRYKEVAVDRAERSSFTTLKQLASSFSHRFLTAETYLLLAILVVALFFRLYNLPDLGLTHFDEGIYAVIGKFFYHESATFPNYWLANSVYAPPGLPLLIGLFMRFFGSADFVALLPSILLGSLTVLPLYLLGRELDSREAGFWSALLLAVTNFHLVFSRLALTDVPLTFFFVSGLWVGLLAFRRQRLWQFITLGLSGAIGWNIKYNGFIAFVFLLPYFALIIAYESILSPVLKTRPGIAQILKQVIHKYWRFLAGLAGAGLLTLAGAVWWYLLLVKYNLQHQLVVSHQNYAIPFSRAIQNFLQHPAYFFNYFTRWADLVFYLTLPGMLLSVWHWRKEKLLLFGWTFGYYLLLFQYTHYTRLAVPLIPAWCLFAGIAIERLFRIVRLLLPGFQSQQLALKLSLGAALIIFAFVREYPVLSLDTNAYRQAGAVALSTAPQRSLIFIDALRNITFYLPAAVYLIPGQKCNSLLQSTMPKTFVFDARMTWNRTTAQFIEANKHNLRLIRKIPNPRYEQILFEPANMAELENVKRHPEKYDNLLHIYIYQLSGAAQIPAEWK